MVSLDVQITVDKSTECGMMQHSPPKVSGAHSQCRWKGFIAEAKSTDVPLKKPERSFKSEDYYIGDRLLLKVKAASKEDKTIDFSIQKKLEENLIEDINESNQVVKKIAKRKLEDNHYRKKRWNLWQNVL